MKIGFIIWSKSNEFNSTFRYEYIFNLVLKFQNKQVWPKWMSSFKSTSKALGLIMSIIFRYVVYAWMTLTISNTLCLLDQEPFTMKSQDKMNKA